MIEVQVDVVGKRMKDAGIPTSKLDEINGWVERHDLERLTEAEEDLIRLLCKGEGMDEELLLLLYVRYAKHSVYSNQCLERGETADAKMESEAAGFYKGCLYGGDQGMLLGLDALISSLALDPTVQKRDLRNVIELWKEIEMRESASRAVSSAGQSTTMTL